MGLVRIMDESLKGSGRREGNGFRGQDDDELVSRNACRRQRPSG